MHTVFTILISITTLTRKRADFNQAEFMKELYCLHCRVTDYLQNMFQDGSSTYNRGQFLENLIYDGKKAFAVLR